jgi:hypothetical protein
VSDELPAKPAPDWNLAMGLFMRGGLSHKSIAAQSNVSVVSLRKRASRGNWVQMRQRLEQSAPVAISLEERSEAVRTGLAADLVQTVSSLPDLKRSSDLEASKKRSELVSNVAATAERVFEWGEKPRHQMVNITFLSDARLVEKPDLSPIDVPSTPVEEGKDNAA